MRLNLTWNQTGDTLLFDVINQDLAVWFVNTSQQLGNRYSLGDQVIDVLTRPSNTKRLIKEEIAYIETVNAKLRQLKMPTFVIPDDWYDQKQLNRLHKDWGESREKWPRLTEIFYKMDRGLFEAYQEMNCHIHLIEDSFEYQCRDANNWRVSNPFKNIFYEWQVSNLCIQYPGHGRYAFEKFRHMDIYEDMGRDNVNWDNIDASLCVNLVRPYKTNPPQQFIEWCDETGLTPHCDNLPLANLSDWGKNLTYARRLITENVTIKENYFSIKLQD